MLIYYKNIHAISRRLISRKSGIRTLLSLVASACLYIQAGAQTETPSTDITALLTQRSVLIDQSQDTRELDLQLFNAGYRPTAVITTQLLENGTKRITFPTYLVIPEERKQRVIDRLTAHYTYLSSMEIDTEFREVAILVPASATTEELNAIFDHFGYLGHEEH